MSGYTPPRFLTRIAKFIEETFERRPKGYWYVQEWKGPPRDIYFQSLRTGCPPTMQVLKCDVERTLSAANVIFRAKAEEAKRRADRSFLKIGYARQMERHATFMARYDEAYLKLLSLARLGLNGLKPGIDEACAALVSFQAELVEQEAGRIKNEYMRRLGLRALLFALVALAIYATFEFAPWLPTPGIYGYRNVLLVYVGAAAGTWASFASRKTVLAFADLALLEDDRLDPWMRLVFTAVLTSFLVLTLITGLATVGVGSFGSAGLLTSAPTALLLGALAGISEKALPTALMQRAQNVLIRSAPGT